MSRTRNTKPTIFKYHEEWAVKNGYRPKVQAPSFKLDKSSSLGYHRTNGKVRHRSRFVGPTQITNTRNAHLVRSPMRTARSTLGSARKPTKVVACADPGDRD